jgi:cell division protein FtsI (penicillin-binding protein 3)
LDIPIHSSNPDNKWVITQTGPDIVKMERRAVTENLVPNVKGMSAQDAVFILENAGMSVKLKGRGAIREQSIAPGQRIVIGERITLDLS